MPPAEERETVTEALAGFTAGLDLSAVPAEVRATARRMIADTLGVTVAGAGTEVADQLRAHLEQYRVERGANVLGLDLVVPAPAAALGIGTLAHALDFDDDEPWELIGHPSAPVFAALAALSQVVEVDGRAFLAAFIAGAEVEIRLGAMVNPSHYDRGWHATSTLGVLGAACGCARALGMDAPAIRRTVGVAASCLSGLKRNFGTMTKPFQVGRAAEAALTAAQLVAAGFTADEEILDGEFGLIALLAGDAARSRAADLLDREWGLIDPGVAVKRYPSCSNTHPALDALLEIREQAQDGKVEIERIVCHVAPGTERMLRYERPATGLEAKFCMPYCLAVAATQGQLDGADFDDAALARPEVQAMMERVELVYDPSLVETSIGVTTAATVHVEFASGERAARTVRHPAGSPQRPLTDEELLAKFETCCGRASLAPSPRAIFERLLRIDEIEQVGELFDRIRI